MRRSSAPHIYGGNLEVIRVLLEADAPPNSTAAVGLTPLTLACAGGTDGRRSLMTQNNACVQNLNASLYAGVDIGAKDKQDALAIHVAATIGVTETIEILLAKASSAIDFTENNGFTPAGIAAI